MLELINRGASSAFVHKFFSHPKAKFDAQYAKANVLNFQRKDDYSKNLLPESVETARMFIEDHLTLFKSAEKRYRVPKEVVAALMFIDTRYGKNTCKHYLVTVFASQAHSNDSEVLQEMLKSARPEKKAEDEENIRNQARRKKNRALREILALEEMQKKNHLPIYELQGSYSGAFGWPQFLPSSYIQFAKTPRKSKKIDLFKADDAIFSVANYLHRQGFSEKPDSQRAAIFHYNNSEDYVDAVLGLAKKLSAIQF